MKFLLPITFLVSSLLVEARWKPQPGLTWDYLLGASVQEIQKSDKQVITIDLKYAEELVPYFHGKGQNVICYFSGGTIEDRDDRKDYIKAGVVFDNYSSSGSENVWIDIRKKERLQPLIRKRFKKAYLYGCDAVEVDDIDIASTNPDITPEDIKAFAKWVAETAHEENVSIGLKNASSFASYLQPYYDFAVVENCAFYTNECSLFKVFTDNNKAVFTVHYGKNGWDLNSSSKVSTLIKEQKGKKYTCVISEKLNLSEHSVNYNCDTGAIIEGKGSTTVTRCGPNYGKCSTGCCSKHGYCGTTESYCGAGCQPDYGTCRCGNITKNGKTSNYGSCSTGYCCSAKGYCGKTEAFCGANCQIDFGYCRCGSEYGSCPSGYCCSKKGYCGKTSAFCGTGCLKAYGKCN